MFFSKRRDKRTDELEARVDRVAIRQVVSEIMLATTVGFVLRSLDESLLRQLMDELRRSVSAAASNEVIALEMEERAAQLLDQIEHLARFPRDAAQANESRH
jgi:hypothetical protein